MQEEDEGIVKKLMNGELKAYELAGLVGGESRAAEIGEPIKLEIGMATMNRATMRPRYSTGNQ